jgi:hypothetical protein
MQKLRDYLDSNNIEWKDKSDDWSAGWICRTHFYYKNNQWSVINGSATYGGFYLDEKQNPGQLELMVDCVNGGEPVGYLKAEDVIKYIEDMKGE